jgi:hypothetical protein
VPTVSLLEVRAVGIISHDAYKTGSNNGATVRVRELIEPLAKTLLVNIHLPQPGPGPRQYVLHLRCIYVDRVTVTVSTHQETLSLCIN